MENLEKVKEALKKVMYFDGDSLLDSVARNIAAGKSVVVLTKQYLGNGRWKLNKYRYKMLVPIESRDSRLYSTDVFQDLADAVKGKYGIYSYTQQYATELVLSLDADLENGRFGHGYTEEGYGRFPLTTNT